MRHYPGIAKLWRRYRTDGRRWKKRKPLLETVPTALLLEREHRLIEANGALYDPQLPLTPEEAVLAADRSRLIARQLETLKPREQRVLELRYGDRELTLDALATAFGVSRERIRQLEATAFRKLRHPSRMGNHLLGWLQDDVRTRHALPDDRFYVPHWKRDEEAAIEHAAYDAAYDEAHALNDAQDMRRAARYAREQGERDEQHYRDWCERQDAEYARLADLRAARARYIAELFTANEARRHAEYVAELYALLGPRPIKVHSKTD